MCFMTYLCTGGQVQRVWQCLVQSAPEALSLIRRPRLCLDSLTGTCDVIRTVTSPIVENKAGQPHMEWQVVQISWGTNRAAVLGYSRRDTRTLLHRSTPKDLASVVSLGAALAAASGTNSVNNRRTSFVQGSYCTYSMLI